MEKYCRALALYSDNLHLQTSEDYVDERLNEGGIQWGSVKIKITKILKTNYPQKFEHIQYIYIVHFSSHVHTNLTNRSGVDIDVTRHHCRPSCAWYRVDRTNPSKQHACAAVSLPW